VQKVAPTGALRPTPQKNSPLHSPIMSVSPRSPRPGVGASPRVKQHPGRDSAKKKKISDTSERIYLQQALAFSANSNGDLESRRYVDKHVDSAKRSNHRRSVSLSFHANDGDEMLPANRQTGSGPMLQPTAVTPDIKRRSRRLPQTMRPSLSSASSASPNAFVVKKRPKELTPALGKVGERLSHRRANSWDPRNDEALRRKSETATLEAALANRKGLARKEHFFLAFVLISSFSFILVCCGCSLC
jgi:hypothetical protein